MLERLSVKFSEILINAEIIKETDADVYVYGFFQAFMLIINVVTMVVLGMAFRVLIPCLLLNFAYISIRIYAGGHHADAPLRCYINSTIMIAVLLSVIKWVSIPFWVLLILMVISSTVIFKFSPVETKNRPLDEDEVRVYRNRSLMVLAIQICIWLILVLSVHRFEQIIPSALFTEAVMLVLGKFKNKSDRDY